MGRMWVGLRTQLIPLSLSLSLSLSRYNKNGFEETKFCYQLAFAIFFSACLCSPGNIFYAQTSPLPVLCSKIKMAILNNDIYIYIYTCRSFSGFHVFYVIIVLFISDLCGKILKCRISLSSTINGSYLIYLAIM
jgi:hypothetical protein